MQILPPRRHAHTVSMHKMACTWKTQGSGKLLNGRRLFRRQTQGRRRRPQPRGPETFPETRHSRRGLPQLRSSPRSGPARRPHPPPPSSGPLSRAAAGSLPHNHRAAAPGRRRAAGPGPPSRRPGPLSRRPGPSPPRSPGPPTSSCRRRSRSRRLRRRSSSLTMSSLSLSTWHSSGLRSAGGFLQMRDTCPVHAGGHGGPRRRGGPGRAVPYLSPPVPLLLLLQDLGARRRLPLRAAQAAAGRHHPGSAPLPLPGAPPRRRFRQPARAAERHFRRRRPGCRSAPPRRGGPRPKEAPGGGCLKAVYCHVQNSGGRGRGRTLCTAINNARPARRPGQ